MWYDAILSRLDKVRADPHKPLVWSASCPCHGRHRRGDRHPSLSLWVGGRGGLMTRCHGCGASWREIVDALGTLPGQWFSPEARAARPFRFARANLAGGRRRVVDEPGRVVATYPYRDEAGRLLYEVRRFEPKSFPVRRPDGKGGWLDNVDGVELVPYRLPEIAAEPLAPVIVVEGEGKADLLASLGLLATTSPFGARKWPYHFGRHLRGRRVAVLPDNDAPGMEHAMTVVGSLVGWHAASVRVVYLPGLSDGDDVKDFLSDMKGKSPQERRANLLYWIRAAPEWVRRVPKAA